MHPFFDDAEAPLVDRFGRVASDLRLSITDKCDLRCTYCMPAEGLQWLPREELLSGDELERIVGLFVSLGVDTVRVTGGEPLVRADVVDVVGRLAKLGVHDLSMTTNGTRLVKLAEPLRAAGLQRVNVSVDSLRPDRFAAITRRDVLPKVLDGLAAAADAELFPVKINCVLQRDVNDDEILDFADFARTTGHHVRFIEPMPLDGDRAWRSSNVVPAAEIVATISAVHPLHSGTRTGVEPAIDYRFVDGAPGSIGVIGSVTDPFCSTCNRLRMTADGQLRNCLFAHDETDLRTPMREGATNEELRDIVIKNVWTKQAGHGISNVNFQPPNRTMSRIGG
jgi:cyclic pyranopterin phosphate synthase